MLKQWHQIESEFKDTLLVGNGASMALNSCFSYSSLFQSAKAHNAITADLNLIFDHFKTTDFEHVMRMLSYAFKINAVLGIQETRTGQAYKDVQKALIVAVNSSHASYNSVQGYLDAIQHFMGQFRIVLSLNYDLTTYWAMLRGNEIRGGNWFKDCWISKRFVPDWERLRDPHGSMTAATLVFYPHGNMLFATDPEEGEIKITVGLSPETLLDSIFAHWIKRGMIPMFVSEGDSQQKRNAISRHGYLSTVYNSVMSILGPSVVIYGWGMGDQDEHILKRVVSSKVKRLAISVLTTGLSPSQIGQHCEEMRYRVLRQNPNMDPNDIHFFDSASPGCWNSPEPILRESDHS